MKCLRNLACNLIISIILLHATGRAEALGGSSYSRRTSRQLAQEATQGADQVIVDRFVVVLREDAGDAAADALVQRVQASLAAEAAARAAESAASGLQQPGKDSIGGKVQSAAQPVDQSVRVIRTLGSIRPQDAQPQPDPPGNSPSHDDGDAVVAAAAASVSDSGSSITNQDNAAAGFEALLLAAPPSAMEHIRQTGLVSAVFRDRIVVPQSIMPRRTLSSISSSSSSSVSNEAGVPVLADAPDAAVASDLSLGQQQGEQQLQDQQQQQLTQETPAPSQQNAGGDQQQQQQQPDQQQHPDASEADLQAQQLGHTNRIFDSPAYRGSSPLQPVMFVPTPASNRPYSRPNRRRRTPPRPSGSSNEDALQRLRAPFATGPAPTPEPAPAPAPSIGTVARPAAPVADSIQQNPVVQQMKQLLRRQGLAAGEQVPAGISFIEAATADAVPYTGEAMQGIQQPVTVAVVDSGVDANHPDLVYAGGKSWVRQPSRRIPGDLTDPSVDFYGHGTHVAGIIGARNTGRGVVGVAPGMPVFSLKVLDGSGQGALSDALAAVRWAAGRQGQLYNIKVINLSIAAFVSSDADDADDTLRIVCQIFKEASDAGVLVVTAAGNYRDSLLNYVPAACPTVATVTAVDPISRIASTFSNYLPADASAADKARVLAAPGSGVLSTMSIQKERSRYRELSGTSQASPHVAGIAATCIQSGACPPGSTGMQKLAIVQAAAVERTTQRQPYGFRGDPVSARGAASQQYYGFLAWSKFWDG